MEVSVLDMSGKQVKTLDLSPDIFEVEVNVGLMHQAYLRQMANARLGTHSTKSRGEVRMSKAKAYRQKGTGRARHGAKSAPIFVGGGVAFGPRPRKYTQKMPIKMRRKAIRCALSALAKDGQLVFVDKFVVEDARTKTMKSALAALTGEEKTLVLLAGANDNVQRGVQNLPNARYLRASYLNIRDLLYYDKIIVPLDALDVIQSIWGVEE